MGRGASLAGDYQFLPLSQPQASSDSNDDSTTGDKKPAQASPLRRFILRASLLVTVPPLITAYFVVVCWVYQVRDPETNQYGHRNALWVYYSWFVIGVFGLGISKYGLTGVEAAMLQDRYWHTPSTMALLMHSGQSWSGPGGWMKCLGILIRQRRFPAYRLWWLLSFLSLIITIALPISGLSMELFDGFVETSSKPLVIGYSPGTFNTKNDKQPNDVPVDVGKAGLLKYDYVTELPNSMSVEQDVPDLFLIPQAKYPASGSAWGLRLSYNCSVVQSVSELTILPKKNSLSASSSIFDTAHVGKGPYGEDVIAVYNTTVNNLFSYVELGAILNTSYYDYGANPKPDIMEYVMRQLRVQTLSTDGPNLKYPFNNTIDTPILGMGSPLVQHANGTFTPNASFLEIQPNDYDAIGSDALHKFLADGKSAYDPMFVEMAPPMGVRCQALSELGTARVDPDDLSFYDFVRVPPGQPEPFNLTGHTLQVATRPFAHGPWEYHLFYNNREYTRYFQPLGLQKSLMRAYAADALQLMYDGLDTFEEAYVAENLIASRPGKILGPGSVPPYISAAMLGIWALGCVLLGLGYGFRRRWAETLEGYSFFRFGADYAEDIGDWPDVLSRNTEFYENGNLGNLPGLIGDSQVDQKIGHISLVQKGNYARRDKSYR